MMKLRPWIARLRKRVGWRVHRSRDPLHSSLFVAQLEARRVLDAAAVSISSAAAVEGNSGTTDFVFTVSLDQPNAQPVSVDYATADGTATAGSDYTARSGTLTFAPGTTSQTIAIAVAGDTVSEADETFFVNLSNPTNATFTDDQGLGTIQNDDGALSITDVTAAEGDSGATNFVFTVSLAHASTQTVSVDYATANGTATAGSDYTATSGTLTFAPGDTSQTITVSVAGDTSSEADETFFVNLSNPTNATLTDNQGLGTIQNDDGALSIADVTAAEGDSGTTNFVFTVSLAHASTQTVSVDYATADGTATAGSDYTARSGTLTFAPGTTSQTIAITVAGDTVSEADETFFVNLTNPSNATLTDNQGLGTIRNNDGALSIDDVEALEGDTGSQSFVFTISLAHASSQTITVNYATANDTATAGSDYTATSGTLTFNPGDMTRTVTVTVGGDTRSEPDEGFLVNLSGATNATLIDSQGRGTILNDDSELSITGVTLTEGNSGTKNFVFTVSLVNSSRVAVSVDFATADGTALAGSDYTATDGTLTFSAGQNSKNITVSVTGDVTSEPHESFFVNLSNPSNGVIAVSQAVGTIQNDDAVLTIDNVTLTEGDSGTTDYVFTVSMANASALNATVNYATANNTAIAGSDYTATNGTLTFAPGDTTRSITVRVNGDTTSEANETFFLNLSGGTNVILADNQGLATILNDDGALSVSDLALTEGDAGTKAFVFAVSLAHPSTQTITVDYATSDGSASANSEYTATSGRLTFAPGTTSQTVTVAVNGDTTSEPHETFFLNLTNAINSTITDGQGQATILNDDGLLSIADVTAIEGSSGTTNFVLTVSLANASALPISVAYATADDTATAGADYTAASGSLTFNPGDVSQTIIVTVVGDGVSEPDESFLVNLSAASNAVFADSQAAATILNDDGALAISDVTAAEGDLGAKDYIFTLSLANRSALTITVDYATANATASAGSDYTATRGTATFQPGDTSQTITVTVGGDTTSEPHETFFVNLTNPVNAALTDNQGLGTILNDDGALLITDVAAAEGQAGVSDFVFTVSLAHASVLPVAVAYATVDGTATAGVDYAAASGSLTFSPGVVTQAFAVSTNGDTTSEPHETYFVNLANPLNAVLADSQGQATILNDDGALSISDVSNNEGDAGTTGFAFTVSLEHASILPVSFAFATSGGTATDGADYATNAGSETLNPGQTTRQITVFVTGDTSVESHESFFVNLGNAVNAQITDSQGEGTIRNDDRATLSISSASVVETNTDQPLAFTVSLDRAVQGGFQLAFADAMETATRTADYQVQTTGPLTFAGNPGETQTVTVTIVGDQIVEDQESFRLLLGAVSGTTAVQAAAITTGAEGSALIISEDQATLSILNLTVVEGDADLTATLAVRVDLAVQGGFQVAFADTTGTAARAVDYRVDSISPLTFVGNAGEIQPITVTIVGDNLVESDESFAVELGTVSATSPTQRAAITSGAAGNAVIANDDQAILSVTARPASVLEGNFGTTSFSFEVSLDSSVQGGFGLLIQFQGTATPTGSQADYLVSAIPNAVGGNRQLRFNGIAGEMQSIRVDVRGDYLLEPNEDITLTLVQVTPQPGVLASNFVLTQAATFTILSDDSTILPANVLPAVALPRLVLPSFQGSTEEIARTLPQPPTRLPDSLPVNSEGAALHVLLVEVRLVSSSEEDGPAILTLPLENDQQENALQHLSQLLVSLPDSRYRVYLVTREGAAVVVEQRLVREIVIRNGKLFEPEEVLQRGSTTELTTPAAIPGEAGARSAPPAETSNDSGPHLLPATGAAEELPVHDIRPATDAGARGAWHHGGPSAPPASVPAVSASSPSLLVPGGAAGLAISLWNAQLEEAIGRNSQRLMTKAARLYRLASGGSRTHRMRR